MNIYTSIKVVLSCIYILIIHSSVVSQCTYNNTLAPFNSDLTPSGQGMTESYTCAWAQDYYTLSVISGETYEISTCATTGAVDPIITLYDNTGTTVLGFNDNFCGNYAFLSYTAGFTGVIHILIDEAGCLHGSTCIDIAVTHLNSCTDPDAPSALAATPSSICPGSTSTITWTGNLNDATQWHICTGSCGGTQVGTTTTNSFTTSALASTTTYFIRGEGGCVTPGSCGQVTVTVGDAVNPTISCPGNQVGSVDASCNFSLPDYTSLATASDNCTASPTVTQSPAPGTNVGTGTAVITLTAGDGNGNTANCNFNVVVSDNTNPTISCPGNQVGNVDGSCNFSLPDYTGLATANDNCPGVIVTQVPAPGTNVGVGTTNIVLTATDASSNTANCNFNVVVSDVINPTITCPGNQTGNVNASCVFTLPDYTGLATPVDNCPGVTVTQVPAPGTNVGVGTTNVVLTATDGSSNTANCNFDVVVSDNTNPTAVCQNITIYLDGTGNATITTGNIDGGSSDNCGGVTLSASQTAFTCADLGANSVTLIATDGNSNTDNCVAIVTVSDTTSPTINCPGNQTGTPTSGCQFTLPDYTGLATATDNCTGSPSITQSPAPSSTAGLGTHTITLTADDGNGNTSQCSFTVTVSSNITGNQTLTECDGFSITVGSNTYTTTGIYTDTLTAVNGCDSIHTTDLTVLAPLTGIVNNAICDGDSVVVNGTIYNASNPTGTEVFTNVGPSNCDSTVTINLNVTTVDVSTTTNNDTITANASGATYQWLDCNNSYATIGGETGQMYIATTTGDYAVEVTQNGCTDTSTCVNIVITSVNIPNGTDRIKVYPNPTTGMITLDFGKIEGEVSYTVTSLGGRLVTQESNMTSNKVNIDLANESKGVYLIKIAHKDIVEVLKLIKQ